MKMFRALAVGLGLIALGAAGPAMAGKPFVNPGIVADPEDIYKNAKDIGNPFESKGVYGKVVVHPVSKDPNVGTPPPLDVYKFTAPQDGLQKVTLLAPPTQIGKREVAAVLVDPTDATEPLGIRLPVPSEEYHLWLLNQEAAGAKYTERALFQNFVVAAEQRLDLRKDKTYYLIVLEAQGRDAQYAVKFGEHQAWSAGDVFANLPAWFMLQFNTFGGISPFVFTTQTLGFVMLILGLAALVGTYVLQEILFFWANRSKSAGYLLVRLQPFSRIVIWVSLWLMLLGGAVAFYSLGLAGLPFMMLLIFVVLAAAFLYQTIVLTPKVAKLEVTNREVTIPAKLRKPWFVVTVVNFIALLAFITYLGMAVTAALK